MHIGIIPDGNRRFMKKRGIPNLRNSYEMGINKFHDFLEWCIDLDVKEVTAYALSTENLKNRGRLEIRTLLGLFSKQAVSMLDNEKIHKNRVRVKVCGDRCCLLDAGERGIGGETVKNLSILEDKTRDYDGLTLNFAIGYGGRQEIINSVKKVVDSGLEITEENIRKNLWVASCPEIVIRTSESRLSNFLTWQSAYSEIYFVDKLWQEFEKTDLERIISDYGSRDRRFGK
ncbi:MAG: di-trans,poly-cis-decaprenylcistransferase [Candidatus Altiarchaeota archaeon]|nr:di-trans,poly-cis-decaprenylcistransferase [Candidatus Altiarchaeota archaeon]